MKYCPNCGEQVSITKRFCRRCGHDFIQNSNLIRSFLQPQGKINEVNIRQTWPRMETHRGKGPQRFGFRQLPRMSRPPVQFDTSTNPHLPELRWDRDD